jgi:glycerol-3-phosphate dehydrogenase
MALAENAAINNVKFLLETKVLDINKKVDLFRIKTSKGDFQSKILINASGVKCREIVSMVEKPDFNIYPCRGEYLVLDKIFCNLINSMIYPVPPKNLGVLGVHITPTIEGNIIIGPSAEFITDSDDKRTTKKIMKFLLTEAKKIIPAIPDKAVINTYSGIRCKIASPEKGGWADYRIEESKQTDGMINLLGIESPGLTSAPAIAVYIKNIISKKIVLKPKDNFKKEKFRIKRFYEMNEKEKSNLIKKDERHGRIICRCENVTEAEVIQALSNPLNAQTISSVKFRCRAGLGRCQGGFCTQHIIRLMEDEFEININSMKLKSPKSNLFYSRTRDEKNE